MDNRLLLAKTIILLYRESLLDSGHENSADLVRTVLENVQVSDVSLGINSDREIVLSLKTTILEMCSNPLDHEYDANELLQRIRLNTGNDDKLYEVIKQSIEESLTDGGLKRSIINIRRSINNHFKEQTLVELLHNASTLIKYNRDKVRDVNEFISQLITRLEPLQMNSSSKDPAVINEVDIGDDTSMGEVLTEMQHINNGEKIYKTGLQDLNHMLQGGFRPGDTAVIGALQHKNKTGFTLSLFAQIAMFNHPGHFLKDPVKKPLLLRISFEDKLVNNLGTLYQYLKYDETGIRVDMSNLTVDEIRDYVKEKLQQNGWHVKMLRVDGDQWTCRSIFNKVTELEAEGYEVKLLMLDYLYKVSKSGCNNNGIVGGEIGDQLSKVRAFCSSKDILHITPHQLSTEAKNLLRSGIPEDQFVNEIAEKGYWEGNKGLDRIYDIGILVHLFKYRGDSYFSVRLDKHRLPTIVDDIYKYFLLKFPKFMPIPSDVGREKSSYRKLPTNISSSPDDIFKS